MTNVRAASAHTDVLRVSDRDGPRLHGRAEELAALESAIERLCAGRGGALVIGGPAGIGKSALLEDAVARTKHRSVRVLTAAGVHAEAQLAFAGLHQLVTPVLDLAPRLPRRQREALLTAFGSTADEDVEMFLIGLATLELIAEASAKTPMLIAIDDAHWMDPSTLAVLAFLSRRLRTTSALLLIAQRAGYRNVLLDDESLPVITLAPVDGHAAAAILADHAPGLDASVRQRVLAEAAGNPLALIELPKALTDQPGRPDNAAISAQPLTRRLERAFADRLDQMPATTRSLLLIGAANDTGELREIIGATAILVDSDISPEALDAAVEAELVSVTGGRLRFRHPLVRSAVYQNGSVPQRQRAHAAIADMLADQPRRCVWHRAAATLGPDDDVAHELDAVAADAVRRGSLAIASAAYQRAATLSREARVAGRRLLRAAELAFELGEAERGYAILGETHHLELSLSEASRINALAAVHADRHDSPAPLVELAQEIHAGGHTDLAWTLLIKTAMAAWWRPAEPTARLAIAEAAETLAGSDDHARLLAVLAHAAPVEHGARVVRQLSGLDHGDRRPESLYYLGAAANAVWAYDIGLRYLSGAVVGLRVQGRVRILTEALTAQAWAAVHTAREPIAVAAAEEAVQLALEMNQPVPVASARLAQATIAAERGDPVAMERLISQAEAHLVGTGHVEMFALVQFVRGRAAVAHQNYEAGLDHLCRLLDSHDPSFQPHVGAWALSDLVEASVRTGNVRAGVDYLRKLDSLAEQTSGSLLAATASYARPLVAGESEAEEYFNYAVHSGLSDWPCYRGRMLLWHGRWLRRQRRIIESRTPLRAARQTFDALAFSGMADLARQELRASGEASQPREDQPWDRLTPRELSIARLAAEGLTNKEIGEKMFLSHRTVAYHLHRVFPKLGITSRSQLNRATLMGTEVE
jgi:DNA-binding CsgD family transcriptional regulator